jgi:hypothetical protein
MHNLNQDDSTRYICIHHFFAFLGAKDFVCDEILQRLTFIKTFFIIITFDPWKKPQKLWE